MALPRKVCYSAVKVFRRSKASPYVLARLRWLRVGLGIVKSRAGQWLLVSARRALVAQKNPLSDLRVPEGRRLAVHFFISFS